MSPAPALVALALSAAKLTATHAQRLWNNLTAEERAEFFALITPKDGRPYKKRTVRLPSNPVKVTRDDGKRLPRFEKGDGDRREVEVPLPDPAYLKDLSSEERDRLKSLIKKANTGKS